MRKTKFIILSLISSLLFYGCNSAIVEINERKNTYYITTKNNIEMNEDEYNHFLTLGFVEDEIDVLSRSEFDFYNKIKYKDIKRNELDVESYPKSYNMENNYNRKIVCTKSAFEYSDDLLGVYLKLDLFYKKTPPNEERWIDYLTISLDASDNFYRPSMFEVPSVMRSISYTKNEIRETLNNKTIINSERVTNTYQVETYSLEKSTIAYFELPKDNKYNDLYFMGDNVYTTFTDFHISTRVIYLAPKGYIYNLNYNCEYAHELKEDAIPNIKYNNELIYTEKLNAKTTNEYSYLVLWGSMEEHIY